MLLRFILGISTIFDTTDMKAFRYFVLWILLVPGLCTFAQSADTLSAPLTAQDSIAQEVQQPSSPAVAHPTQTEIIGRVLAKNQFIDSQKEPKYFLIELKTWSKGKEIAFYVMCGLLLILGLFRTFYSHYFSTLFSVYFNTSLRQSQLSEQLLQARLPSFILNLFFIMIGGIFCWLLFLNAYDEPVRSPYLILYMCLIAVGVIYIVKFCFLKFLGWLSGMQDVTNQYIFIIFLVNKLLAVVLVPFVILIAFGKAEWLKVYTTLALLCIGALFFSRYVKSYGLLRQKFPMSPFHFIIFFSSAELIPLLLIYKLTSDYLIA